MPAGLRGALPDCGRLQRWVANVLLLLVMPSNAADAQGCYVANTTSFPWCSGYAKAGYDCSADGTTCASATCLASCGFCAVHYPDAALHASTGQCCDPSTRESGECRNPRDGNVYHFPYGPADHHPTEIFEGCVQYEHGPTCWKPGEIGDYGWSALWPDETQPGGCPPLPPNFDASKVRVAKMTERIGSSYRGCFIECNLTQVSETGVDPCSAGDFSSPTSGHNKMSCYSGGEKFIRPFPSGMCGYNCTLIHPSNGTQCRVKDPLRNDCVITCSDSTM
jgi:hypothetical protein